MTKKRDASIDTLRAIGIVLIFLAHSITGSGFELLFKLRCFDVPLMIFVSGLAFANKDITWSGKWFWQRAKRLIVPLFVFLTIYFLIAEILSKTDIGKSPTLKEIALSYTMISGIGYVWIFRIFLYIALLTPLLQFLCKKIQSAYAFYLLIFLLFAFSEVLGNFHNPLLDQLVYPIGYSGVFMVGLRLGNAQQKVKTSETSLFLLLLAVALVAYHLTLNDGVWYDFNKYKYPPQAYFLLYGIFCSVVLYAAFRFKNPKENAVVSFIGSNTNWLYLWHIPIVKMTDGVVGAPLRFLIICIAAYLIVRLQIRLVNKYTTEKNKHILKYFRG